MTMKASVHIFFRSSSNMFGFFIGAPSLGTRRVF
jgi:hypothetical protein